MRPSAELIWVCVARDAAPGTIVYSWTIRNLDGYVNEATGYATSPRSRSPAVRGMGDNFLRGRPSRT